jgi:formamidopyrimidine-DNA glycosylase
MEGDLFLVFHLMIAGRFKWRPEGTKSPAKVGLASFDFPTGTLLLTEASPKHRASLHVVGHEAGLAAHDPGGLDVRTASLAAFKARLQSESHTLKRALTDPHLFDGIGNWLSDEILHAAKLSLFQLTGKLTDEEIARLYSAVQATTRFWIEQLRAETGTKFPEKVSAFKEGMAVHGRYREPCPVCSSPIQRIRYADNEANYCATCQTAGRVLADRSLSRLLKADWPRSLEEWEAKLGR